MPRRPRGPSVGPKKQEWVFAALQLRGAMTDMIARWGNGIPEPVRIEMSIILTPTEDLLIRARLIGQRRHGSTDMVIGN